jgi:hypothetical protein
MQTLSIRWIAWPTLIAVLLLHTASAQTPPEAKPERDPPKTKESAPVAKDAKPAKDSVPAKEAKAPAVAPATVEVPDDATADYVKTTTDLVFHGKIIEETPEQVVVLTKTGAVPIPRAIIKEVHKQGVDTRPASEKIVAVEIPAGQEAAFVDKAKALSVGGKHAEAAAICKALMEAGPTKVLTDAQRDSVGRVAAVAYYELKDWPAAATAVKYSAQVTKEEVGRNRLMAIAEALENNTPPRIGDETADHFDQAVTLAMKWKAERFFKEAFDYALSLREYHRQEIIDRALDGAAVRLNKAEPYVPGISVTRQPEILRAMVTDMLAAVDKAVAKCTTDRAEMIRVYAQRTASADIARAWNVRIGDYLTLRQAAEDCLINIATMGANRPLKAAYKDEEYKQLEEQTKKLAAAIEALKFYDADAADLRGNPIRIKGKMITLIRIGS